jgi:uncharacterized integral membrane protein
MLRAAQAAVTAPEQTTGSVRSGARDEPALVRSKMTAGPAALAAGAVVVGLIVRLWFLLTPIGAIDGDEAVTGFMAHRIAHGSSLYTFFAGQHYNAALEQYLQAAVFALHVPESALTLRLPQLALSAVTIWLMYAVGRRITRSQWHAAVAALAFAVGPYFLIWRGARSTGYTSSLLPVLVGLWCALRLSDEDAGRRSSFAVGLGITLGLGYYINAQAFATLLPALWWAAPTIRRRRRLLLALTAGVVAGLSPVLLWALGDGSFPIPDPGYAPTTPLERLGYLLDDIGREHLGVAHLSGQPGWPRRMGLIVVGAAVAGVVLAFVVKRSTILRFALMRREGRDPVDILLVSIVLACALLVASPAAYFSGEPRYLFCSFPSMILLATHLIPRRAHGGLRRYLMPLGSVALLAFIGGPAVTMIATHAHDVQGDRDRDMATVTDVLEREGTRFVYADYWTAMNLQFVAGDRLTVGSASAPQRLPLERKAVDRAARPPWVASVGVNTSDIVPMRDRLVKSGVTFRERRVRTVSIFDQFVPDVRPWDVGIGTLLPPDATPAH